jgi:thiamine biosynthesis lipoprotein
MNPNRPIPKTLPFLLIGFVAFSAYKIWPGSPGAPAIGYELSGPTMGTTYQVKLRSNRLSADEQSAIQSMLEFELRGVNEAMSTYMKTSELSRFNHNESTAPVSFSDATLEVIALSQEISVLSGGAFDVTVGPLVNAWGFGPDTRRDLTDEDIDELKKRVGYQMLTLNSEAKTVSKARPDIYVDLSAVAKGYAVDVLSRALLARGYPDHMVEIGGELRCQGINPEGQPWRIAIEKPDTQTRATQEILELQSMAMATSGDYRNYYEKDGKRLSHTIDTRTGRPITHTLASVTVLDPSCARADALATALNVLGPEEGLALAEREKIAAFFLVRSENGQFEEKWTAGFAEQHARVKSSAGE